MPPFPSKDDGPKPTKRIGVWSNEGTKQKNNVPEKVVKQIANDYSFNDDDEMTSPIIKNNIQDATKTQLKSNLFKLPALDSLNINIGLFLNQFDDEEDTKEVDTVWTQDSLFTEIMNSFDVPEKNRCETNL